MLSLELFKTLKRYQDCTRRIASRNLYIGVETWRVCLTNLEDGIKVEALNIALTHSIRLLKLLCQCRACSPP
jgi:hypothetical protein